MSMAEPEDFEPNKYILDVGHFDFLIIIATLMPPSGRIWN